MKKLLVLAVAALVATPAFAADLKWYGEAGVRYSQKNLNDGMGTSTTDAGQSVDRSKEKTKKHDIRARLGVTGGKDHIDYGIGMHTSTAINNDYVTYGQNSADLGVAIELAYFRYTNDYGFGDLSVTFGRQDNVFAFDHYGQFLFDNDVVFDGFGWKWKMGNFGINAAQYLLGAVSSGARGATQTVSSDYTQKSATANGGWSTLIGWQPNFSFRFTDEIEAMFAVGYYIWQNAGGSNNLHGEQSVGNPTANTTSLLVDNPKIIQILADVTLPHNFGFTFEWDHNKKYYYDEFSASPGNVTSGNYGNGHSREVKHNAWAGTLAYGKIARAHDWKLAYTYGSKGLASGVNTYTNNLFLADQKGHTVGADYAVTDTLSVGAKYMNLKEISNLDVQGNAVGNATTSNGQGSRSHKVNYWQLTAGVAF